MIEQTDVYVKNTYFTESIQVSRKLPDGSSDLNITVAKGNEEKIYLGGLDVSLLIKAPNGAEIRYCPVKVRADVDMGVSHSRTDATWSMKILPNSLEPELPITVNVTVGEDGP